MTTDRDQATRDRPELRCAYCTSTAVNHWKSWNTAGEWVCDECAPSELYVEDDWL